MGYQKKLEVIRMSKYLLTYSLLRPVVLPQDDSPESSAAQGSLPDPISNIRQFVDHVDRVRILGQLTYVLLHRLFLADCSIGDSKNKYTDNPNYPKSNWNRSSSGEFFYWPILSHIAHPNLLEERTTMVSTPTAMNELLITLINRNIKKIMA